MVHKTLIHKLKKKNQNINELSDGGEDRILHSVLNLKKLGKQAALPKRSNAKLIESL